MPRSYNINLQAWQEQLYASGKYRVLALYADRDKYLGNEPPSYVDIDVSTEDIGKGVRIQGELVRIFMREFKDLHYRHMSWPQPPMYKFLSEWVTRMDNVALALKAMGLHPDGGHPDYLQPVGPVGTGKA